ncbi:MAG: hypothetical protein ACOC9Y_06620, partial [Chloroflexota bacterium]
SGRTRSPVDRILTPGSLLYSGRRWKQDSLAYLNQLIDTLQTDQGRHHDRNGTHSPQAIQQQNDDHPP